PASLDVEGIAGLKSRLDAGANVITSIVPPHEDLAGVAQHELDIDNGHRSVAHVLHMLDGMGKKVATCTEYESLLKKLKAKNK
ncbi:MAG: methylornithine synthase PylB, partial [Methanomassiliicoccaceae archaeon]|nr:methylornithine synthase PylB [Methanomassiliicoccaceae archaeon]